MIARRATIAPWPKCRPLRRPRRGRTEAPTGPPGFSSLSIAQNPPCASGRFPLAQFSPRYRLSGIRRSHVQPLGPASGWARWFSPSSTKPSRAFQPADFASRTAPQAAAENRAPDSSGFPTQAGWLRPARPHQSRAAAFPAKLPQPDPLKSRRCRGPSPSPWRRTQPPCAGLHWPSASPHGRRRRSKPPPSRSSHHPERPASHPRPKPPDGPPCPEQRTGSLPREPGSLLQDTSPSNTGFRWI